MNNNTNLVRHADSDGSTVILDEFDGERPCGLTKSQFRSFVAQLVRAHQQSHALYQRVVEQVGPHDKELSEHLRAVQVMEDRLVAYCQRKLEAAKG